MNTQQPTIPTIREQLKQATDDNYRAIRLLEDDIYELKRSFSRLLEEVSKSDSFEFLKDHWETCHQEMQAWDECERSAYSRLCDANTALNDLQNYLHDEQVFNEDKQRNNWRVEMMLELYGLDYREA